MCFSNWTGIVGEVKRAQLKKEGAQRKSWQGVQGFRRSSERQGSSLQSRLTAGTNASRAHMLLQQMHTHFKSSGSFFFFFLPLIR